MADFTITSVVEKLRSALDLLKSADLRTGVESLTEELVALDNLYVTGTVQAKRRSGDEEADKWLADARQVAFDVECMQLLIENVEMNKLKKRRGAESKLLSWSRYAHIPSQLISPILDRIHLSRTRKLCTIISEVRQRYPSIEIDTQSREPQIEEVIQDDSSTAYDDDLLDTFKGVLLNASISRRCVLFITGMRGIGKTTLGQRLYHNVQARAHFETRAWVTLTDKCFKARQIMIRILKEIMFVTKYELKELDTDQLTDRLSQTLKEKRYLIVVDDLPRLMYVSEWQNIMRALPDSNNGSRLLLISRLSLSHLNVDALYTVPRLSHQQGWELFVKSAFPLSSSACPDHLQGISREFVRIWGGHPHSLKLAGALVSTRDPNVTEWTQVLHTVTAAVSGWHLYEEWLRLPALYYTDLSDNRARSCFLSLRGFRRYKEIEASKMIGMWIARGFIPQPRNSDGDATTLEEKARVYLGELVRRSMLRVVKEDHDGSPLTCQVDPLFHDLCAQESKDEEVVNKSLKRRFFITKDFFSGPIVFFGGIGLSDMDYMIHLRYFEARSQSWITKLSSLPYLQTLDIRKTGITQLPSSLGEVTTLRHLFMSGCEVCAPIGRLINLQTLTVVNDRGGYVERDLAQLSSIRVLGITVMAEDLNLFFSALNNLKHIFSLYLQSKIPINILDHSEAPQIKLPDQLQKLYLEGRVVTQGLPLEPFFSKNLAVLTLDGSKLDQDPMKKLGELSKLKHLALKHDAYVGKDMECLPGGFPELQSLHLQCLRNLVNWKVGQGSMSNLISLSIVLCDGLAMLPDEVQHLTSLLELEVIDPRDDFLRRLQQDGDDWHKIGHVASIKLNPMLKRRSPYRIEVDRF